MSALVRALMVLATASAITFPSTPPTTNANLTTATNSVRRRAAAPPAATPSRPQFEQTSLEYYLSDDGIAYIRPGIKLKVNSITIGADRKPVVDVTFTDNMDQPLDRNGKLTPGAISASFILAYWNAEERHYTAYTTRTVTTPANSPHPGVTAIQANTDANGKWTDLELGHAKYTFGTALPANYSTSATTTLGFQAVRNLTDIIGKNYIANLEYDFRWDGTAVKPNETWAKITDASSCLNCHDKETFGFHGSAARRDVKLCVLCHQPQTTDPDTGETMDFKVMIHKIHYSENLPSVKAGKPYIIIGNAQSVHDFSHITYPQDVRNCDNCHEGTVAASKPLQSDVWYSQPNAAACGSCHDDVNFTTGANHPAGAQPDSACASCHVADSGHEFDASVKGAHVIPEKSAQLKGLNIKFVSITNVKPGDKPTVTFKITNGDGSAVDGSKLTSWAPIIAGPTTDYTKYIREAAQGKATAIFDATSGNTSYTFTAAIPADAKGTWTVSSDTYRNSTIKRADGGADITLREAAVNPIANFNIGGTGTVTPRRTVVSLDLCNKCHDRLALHGGQRLRIEECVICHNPVESDAARRPADKGPAESVSFQRMIHRIHSGEELTQDFTIYGFGGTPTNFNEVTYPGDRRNCASCHVNDSQQLPPAVGTQNVITLRDWFSPQGPGTAACLGCHDNRDAAAHAVLNTTTLGGQPAEACATCHGANSEWSVNKVHAR